MERSLGRGWRRLGIEFLPGRKWVFCGYLTRHGDAKAQLSELGAPIHRKGGMTQKEREIRAYYSAINMPIKPEDAPEDLRL